MVKKYKAPLEVTLGDVVNAMGYLGPHYSFAVASYQSPHGGVLWGYSFGGVTAKGFSSISDALTHAGAVIASYEGRA